MLNVFVGFEQTNKYSICKKKLPWVFLSLSGVANAVGEQVGYIAEEPRGLIGVVARQVFATHRPFRAVILDSTGTPLLWVSDVLNLSDEPNKCLCNTAPETILLD